MKPALGLYIHIPFCASKCGYCDFYSIADAGEDVKNGYLKALEKHMDEYVDLLSGHYTVDTVYIGGGTPSQLGEKRLLKLISSAEKKFSVAKDAEITVEINPENADYKFLKNLRSAGVNRLSIGMQSSDDAHLRALGRIHDAKKTETCVEDAKRAGFTNISLDLMYALPNQTIEDFMRSIDDAVALGPQHLSCYALKLEPGVRMYPMKEEQPDDDTQADMYLAMIERLKKAGFAQYEISNFCRPGFRSKHNFKYWDLSEYLGIGPGAHSFLNGMRFSYVKDANAYIDGILKGEDISDERDEISTKERHGEYIMLMLRTSDGIDEDKFYRMFGLDFSPYAEKLEKYRAGGFALHDYHTWRLTEKGFFVSNTIISDIISVVDDRETANIKI